MVNVSWELQYKDRAPWRPIVNIMESVAQAPKDAVSLTILQDGQPVRVVLLEGKPIFYRWRSIDIGPGATGGAFDEAVIFGYGGAESLSLWAWDTARRDGVPCPPQLLDEACIAKCLGVA